MQTFVLSILIILVFPKPVQAYLDPGTGSYIFQLALGGVFAALFTLKQNWKRIQSFIQKLKTQKRANE